MRPWPEVLVIGAGVSGLTTAVCLAEAGLPVRILTKESPHATTSCAAGAIWSPYLVTEERVVRWRTTSLAELKSLAADPATGVRLVTGREASRVPVHPPDWAVSMVDFRDCAPEELPDGFASGWWYTTPVVEMPRYLSYLEDRARTAGVKVELGMVDSLAEALRLAPAVVNCTGFGARSLVPDTALIPSRGQLVVVENPGITEFFVEHDECPAPTYFLPHGDHVVLGGSVEEGGTDLVPHPATAVAIQHRCAEVEPALGKARVLEHRVGLRPGRSTVRLERVSSGTGYVVHNYGHGGSGVTLSWGCAREVLRLIEG